MNKVILIGAAGVMPHICFSHIEVPPHVVIPSDCTSSVNGYIISEDRVAELQRIAHLLSVSYVELLDAIQDFRYATHGTADSIASLSEHLFKLNYIQDSDLRFSRSKVICTKPFKSKINKSHHAASSYQRSGFQASRKLARGRI